jgi:thymidine phosphorylase
MMEYRDIEYTVVQGIGRDLWKWSASVADVVITGQAHSKSAAVAEAEKAIDRALALKKLRLVPTQGGNEYALAIHP